MKIQINKTYVYLGVIVTLVLVTFGIYWSTRNNTICIDTTGYEKMTFGIEQHSGITPSGLWEFSVIQPIILDWGEDGKGKYFVGQISPSIKGNCTLLRIYYAGTFEAKDSSSLYEDFTQVVLDNEFVASDEFSTIFHVGEQIRLKYLTTKPDLDQLTADLCSDKGIYCTVQRVNHEIHALDVNLDDNNIYPNGTSGDGAYLPMYPLDYYSELITSE